MLQSVIQRAALGREAKIGALYNVRTESFTGDNLFGSNLDEAIDTMDLEDKSIELVREDNFQQKVNKLDVEPELQVSVLTGLLELSGSGAYLSEQRKSARAQSMSLLYKLRTVNEEFLIRQNKSKIDVDILSSCKGQALEATHVVVAMDWGAICTFTCEYENQEDDDVTKVKEALSAELEKLKDLIDDKGSTKTACNDHNEDNDNKFTYKCQADVSDPEKDLSATFDGAVDFARNLPGLVQNTNDGKGVPLVFMLMPLEAIVKMCRLRVQLQLQYRAIDDDIITRCVQDVEGITKTRQTLFDIHNDLHACADYVPEESLNRIDYTLGKFIVEESAFKASLQCLVKKVRSGNEDLSAVDQFLSKEMSDKFSLSRSDEQIEEFQKDINKVKAIKSWRSKGIIYIGRKGGFTVDDEKIVYVFFKSCGEDNKNALEKNQEFFLRLQKTHAQDDDYRFIVLDQEVRNDLWPAGTKEATIHKFVNGNQESHDLFAEEGQEVDTCLIDIARPVYTQIRPGNRANVKLRCPNALSGSGECTGNPVTWMCSKCKHVVEYGIENRLFYCRCGQSDPTRALFRCNEMDHGMDFVKYPNEILTDELSELQTMKDKNILILGETGVGKSTWINGFINYLYYADLEEAINAKEFHVLIPSSFTFTQAGKEKKILIGDGDANENMETGKSATKEPRSYIFYVGEQRIRLIDTPGVGDSEGIQQDKKNFDKILSHLSYYDEIHAVCILLKPNNSRLTAMFRFCIQELLAHLHTSAKGNIVFCFTNARATFYQPGDTLPALNAELDKRDVGIQATPHNYFCFDNEPFRFLACVKNEVEFSPGEVNTYAESWNKSVEETMRLFEHINTLRPHKVKNTVNMNEARRIIVAMSKPLAEVAKTIQHNVQQGNEVKEQIDICNKDMNSLKDDLTFSGFSVRHVQLGYPRTVCADSRCITHVPVGESNVQNTIYDQICHHHCYVSGIPTETTNNPGLQGCECIRGTTCRHCGHHYTTHMHITYSTQIVPEQFLSKEVQAQINQKKCVKEAKEAAKRAIDIKNKELMEEEILIMKTSAKYGSFLKANAIIPYNDAVGDYLDMTIEQERNKIAEIRNDSLLGTLESMKRQYEHERRILDSAIGTNTGENINTPEEVMELQKELFGLKHMGKTLKDLFDGISIANSANNIAFREKIAPIRQNYRRRGRNHIRNWMGSFPSLSRPLRNFFVF